MVNLKMARMCFKRFDYELFNDGCIWHESQFEHCKEAYEMLGRKLPRDIAYIFVKDKDLRTLAFDALAGNVCERAAELPESLRAEYWRRRWLQLAIEGRCTAGEFADGMLSENAQ